jgi:hypothetical protein
MIFCCVSAGSAFMRTFVLLTRMALPACNLQKIK